MYSYGKEDTALITYVADLRYDLPEERYLRAVVKPVCDQELPFEVESARWELYYRGDDEEVLEASGECEINGHELAALISPQKAGTYRFKYIYTVAGETWVDNIRIKTG